MTEPCAHNRYGFTIVELLIVIVVIAILAAISVVTYNGIQIRANSTAVESDASSIYKKMEIAKVDLGRYPSTYDELPDFKISRSSYDDTNQNVMYCYNGAADRYAVSLIIKGRSKQYTITDAGVVDTITPRNHDGTCQVAGLSDWASRTYGAVGHWSSGDWTTFKWVTN